MSLLGDLSRFLKLCEQAGDRDVVCFLCRPVQFGQAPRDVPVTKQISRPLADCLGLHVLGIVGSPVGFALVAGFDVCLAKGFLFRCQRHLGGSCRASRPDYLFKTLFAAASMWSF